MGSAIYAYLFAVVMSANAVTTSNGVLSVVDWVLCSWLFFAGTTQILHHYRSKDIIEVNWYDED